MQLLAWNGQITAYVRVVAANHLAVGDLMAKAVSGLIGVDGHIQDIGRMTDGGQCKC